MSSGSRAFLSNDIEFQSKKMECPACNHFVHLYRNIQICQRCGLGKTIGHTEPEQTQDYITEGSINTSSRVSYFKNLYRKYFRYKQPGRSLDVGCGRGEFVEILGSHGWEAHGIDAFKGFSGDGAKFFQAELGTHYPRHPYDLISLIHSFEHMRDPLDALQHAKRLLKPDGRLLIVVPNFGGNWSRLLGDRWHMLCVEHHVFHYTLISLNNILAQGGFAVRSMATYSGYAPTPWQIRLGEMGFYDRGWGARQPLRSLIFRGNALLRPLWNAWIDLRREGAEIQVVAQLRAS